jgi:hypothetical protein
MKVIQETVQIKKEDLPVNINLAGWGLTILGLLLIVIAFVTNSKDATPAYLIGFIFLLSIGLGAFFLVALEYTAGAVWSTPMRRVSEFLASILLILPVFVIPLLLNLNDLFIWSHRDIVANDPNLIKKAPYLNTNFFIIRTFIFLFIWIIFYAVIVRNSNKQDKTGDPKLTTINTRLSAIFMPIFGLTITFIAIDWMMSLTPHWYSTIFGVYFFSGVVLAALAAATLIIVLLKEKGKYFTSLVQDHYYSLGALLFAFVNFWAYIAFSQYLLIWYADLPEETSWFFQRWDGNWKIISIALIFIHFVVPYFGLLSQYSKMNPKRLIIISVWILFAHYLDLYWLIMPSFNNGNVSFGWVDVAAMLLVAGIIIVIFNLSFRRNNIMPVGDPKLKDGLDFRL